MEELPTEQLTEVCKMGGGPDTCRFLVMHPDAGMTCAKYDLMLVASIELRAAGMAARGDNCTGPPEFKVKNA